MNPPCLARPAGRIGWAVLAALTALLAGPQPAAAQAPDHPPRAVAGWLKTAVGGTDPRDGVAPLGPGPGAVQYQQVRLQPPMPLGPLAGLKREPLPVAKGRLPIGLERLFDPAVVVSRDTAPAGAWTVLPTGWRIYSVAVGSPGALGLRLHLEALALPKGARLLVYDPDNPAQVTAPVTAERISSRKELWVETLFAQQAVLECQVPPGADPAEVSFAVTSLVHLYRLPSAVASPLFQAGPCNNDVTCYPAWAHEAAGVAELSFVDEGTNYLCTGCLLSNGITNNPADYFLTAHHCIPNQTVAATLEWFWFYQTHTCNGRPPSLSNVPHTSGGADLLATSGFSDFAFLQMRQAPPTGVYYLGWSRQAPMASDTLTLISHPSGDYKRISFGHEAGLDSSFWWVEWFSGVSEPGSSGGPLFNPQHQVIGQLWGGSSSCDTPRGIDAFGRFDVTYNAIARWIDPLYALRGAYHGLFQPTNAAPPTGMGVVTLTLTPAGSFSGRLQAGSARYALSGHFDSSGDAQVPAHGGGTNNLKVSLHLDLTSNTERITGTVQGSGWLAGLLVDRAGFGSGTNAAPEAGRYTLVFPGKTGSPAYPAGDSYATVLVDRAGHVQLAAALGDGTRTSQGTAVSKYGQVPVYLPVAGGSGFVMGWATFTNTTDRDLDGELTWVKPPGAGRSYPGGFSFKSRLSGSHYSRPLAGQPLLDLINAALVLSGGNPGLSLTNTFPMNSDKAVNLSADGFRLSFVPGTGVFQGRVAQSGIGPAVSFSGVVLTNQNRGFGSFLEGGLSGQALLEQAP